MEVPTHTMLRAALKRYCTDYPVADVLRPDTHNAACGIETRENPCGSCAEQSPDTHNAACGIDSKTALRVHIGHTEPFSYAKSAQQS